MTAPLTSDDVLDVVDMPVRVFSRSWADMLAELDHEETRDPWIFPPGFPVVSS